MNATQIAEQNARRMATRTQIIADQATNAKRDAKALKAEAAWIRKNSK